MPEISRRLAPRPIQRATLWLLVAGAFLILFRPVFAFRPSWGGVDDECYKAWLAWMVGGSQSLCHSNSYLPGIALTWLPAGAIAMWLHHQTGVNLQNLTAVGIGLTSFFSWAAGLFLIASVLHRRDERRWSLDAVLFTMSVPVIYYATSRTSLAHAGEFLLGAATLRALDSGRIPLAAALGVWLTMTRLNDAPVFLLILGTVADRGNLGALLVRLKQPLWASLVAVLSLAAVFFLFDLTFVGGYNKVPLIWHLFRFRWERVSDVLWGSDWGLLWTAPFWLVCLTVGCLRWRHLSWCSRGAVVWMGMALGFCCLWPGNGSDFGYRYLIGSYFAAFLLWREVPPRYVSAGRILLAVNGIWLTLLTIAYQTAPHLRPQRHWLGWVSPNLQWEALYAVRSATTYLIALSWSALGVTLTPLRSTSLHLPEFMHWGRTFSPGVRVATTTTAIIVTLICIGIFLKTDRRRRHG